MIPYYILNSSYLKRPGVSIVSLPCICVREKEREKKGGRGKRQKQRQREREGRDSENELLCVNVYVCSFLFTLWAKSSGGIRFKARQTNATLEKLETPFDSKYPKLQRRRAKWIRTVKVSPCLSHLFGMTCKLHFMDLSLYITPPPLLLKETASELWGWILLEEFVECFFTSLHFCNTRYVMLILQVEETMWTV